MYQSRLVLEIARGSVSYFEPVELQSDKRPFCCRTTAPLISVQRIVAVSQASLQKVTAANAQTGLLEKTAQKRSISPLYDAIFLKGYSILVFTKSVDSNFRVF